jgi:hypothetical protein
MTDSDSIDEAASQNATPKVDSSDMREPTELTIHLIKSSGFRVVHCDGAIGGPSPNGEFIHMAVYSERVPIPIQMTYAMAADGVMKDAGQRVAREGVVREIEFDMIMTPQTADRLADWLKERVSFIRATEKEAVTRVSDIRLSGNSGPTS